VEQRPSSTRDTSARPVVRFGEFELDLRSADLRKRGQRIRLQEQPFRILVELLERPGQLVLREEIQKRLWPDNTIVEFDHSINAAIKRLRDSLQDSAESPRFIETIAKRGYRFIAPVSREQDQTLPSQSTSVSPSAPNIAGDASWMPPPQDAFTVGHSFPKTHMRQRLAILAVCCACVLLTGAGWFAYKKWRTQVPTPVLRTLTRFTFDEGLQTGATWSPDGRYIAYSSDRDGKFDIWVQQVSGGDPVQITKGPGHHWQPDWSPDGKYIAYRSEDGDGGIYVAPALGGAGLERKIAPFGYHPQWAPDSLQVLFQAQFTEIPGSGRFYIARLDGSAPREVLAEFFAQNKLWATSAAWHPDGKRVTVWVTDLSPTPSFWMVSIAGGPGIKLEIPSAIQRALKQASGEAVAGQQQGDYSFSWSSAGDAIYFERVYGGARNIWKMTVDPETLRAVGIERLTTGPGPDTAVAVSRDGRRLAFTAKSQRIQTWLFPFDARTGQIKGKGNAITPPGRTSIEPNLSPDGTKVAYCVHNGEGSGPGFIDIRNELWIKSLVDGSDAPVISDSYSRWFPHWSPDGMQLIYQRRKPGTNEAQLMLWSSHSHEEEPLTGLSNYGGVVYDWSPDGKWLLGAEPHGILLLPAPSAPHAGAAVRKVVSNPAYGLHQQHMSPDGRWIVFNAVANSPNPESALYVVPSSGGPWTRITDGKHWDDKPRWSPDGRTIYFVSGPGGFFNVWGIHFHPAAGKPVGQPFQVSKFDSPRLMIPRWIPPVGLSFTQDKLVLTMAEESGSIWILDNVNR
jgi:Tol biopolymer transport system component/DNA-binding winged helix-turn-helix (wHTH) protein